MNQQNEERHVYVVCAYKESPYLEECIISLTEQSKEVKVVVATSTPCEYIERIADKYNLNLFVRDGVSDIKEDWNFAYDCVEAEWVTLVHQDDTYHKDYEVQFRNTLCKYNDAIAYITDYYPIKNGIYGKRDVNSVIRRLLRIPLKSKTLAGKRFWKRGVLALGNSICCPTVTYNKKRLGVSFFTSDLKFNIDWDTFLKFSDIKGGIAYCDKPLVNYRVHDGATSKLYIDNKLREKEDGIMFRKFWPAWLVKVIMLFYKRAYDTYN